MMRPSFLMYARLMIVCGPVITATAGESILGLPAPRDPSRPGAVMLHGGGRVTNEAFDRFVELAGGDAARIVIVPSAGYRRADYSSDSAYRQTLERRYSSWVRLEETGRVRSVEFLSTDDPDDADDPEFVRPLESATGVWFVGGAQSRLNYRYVGEFPRKTRFQLALRDVVARGGVVGGTSAGMAAMPEIMALHQTQRRTQGPAETVAAHGLGLFDGAIVEQHFDGRGGRLERFTSLLRDSERLDRLAGRKGAGDRMLGLAVEGSTALILRGDRLEAIGAGEVHVFSKSPGGRRLWWQTLHPGEATVLNRDPRGGVSLASTK
jgi:cyanophycinase